MSHRAYSSSSSSDSDSSLGRPPFCHFLENFMFRRNLGSMPRSALYLRGHSLRSHAFVLASAALGRGRRPQSNAARISPSELRLAEIEISTPAGTARRGPRGVEVRHVQVRGVAAGDGDVVPALGVVRRTIRAAAASS